MITVGAADEKIQMLWDKFDEGAREAGKDPIGDAEAAPDPRLVGARPTRRPIDNAVTRVAERRHAVPQAGHPQPRGLRGDGQAGPPGALQEPRPDDQRPRARTRATSSTTSTWASTRSTSTTSGRNQAEFIEVFGKRGPAAAPARLRARGHRPDRSGPAAARPDAPAARRARGAASSSARPASRLEADPRRRVAVEHVDRVHEADLLGLVGHHQRVRPRAATEEADPLEQVAGR